MQYDQPLENMDPYEGLNFAHEALTRVRNPIGKKSSPGRDCRDISNHNPDLKNGFYWIDPNGKAAYDAIEVYCRLDKQETCIRPPVPQYEKQRWTKRADGAQYFMDDINNKKEFIYMKELSQLKFLQLRSNSARQTLTYHCLNSKAYGTRLVFYNGDEMDSASETTFKKFTRLSTQDECVLDNQWHTAVFDVRTNHTDKLPVMDVLLFDVGQENQQFGIDLGEVCYS